MKVWFCDSIDDQKIKFSVIVSRYHGKWVFCKHRDRSTLECPGGHREAGETMEDTAKRELFEETGALDFLLRPAGVYAVEADDVSYGALFYAEIFVFGELPPYEIESVVLCDRFPDHWTYPEIQPKLLERVQQHFNL